MKSVYSLTDEKIRGYIKNIEKIHVSNDDTLGYLKKSSNETGKVTGKVAKQSTDANFALVLFALIRRDGYKMSPPLR